MVSYEGRKQISIGAYSRPNDASHPGYIRINFPIKHWGAKQLPAVEDGKWMVQAVIDPNTHYENDSGVVLHDMNVKLTFIPEELIRRLAKGDQDGLVRMEIRDNRYRLTAHVKELETHYMKKEDVSSDVKFPVLIWGTGAHYPVIEFRLQNTKRTNAQRKRNRSKADRQKNSTFFEG